MQLSTEAAPSTAPSRIEPERQQKDHLCGPFHAARVLRDIAGTESGGEPLDQDLVALHAGTALPARAVGPQVPPGAASHRGCRFGLPRVEPERSGTSPSGLATALTELSGGRLVCVPVSGAWTAVAVERLVADACALGARLLANIRTGLLWASRPPREALIGALSGTGPEAPPAADWDTGHFVELVELVRGRAGALVIVQDSYPTLGWNGTHLQPPGALAAALMRGDGRDGGVLAVVSPQAAPAATALVGSLGLATQMWDNSSEGDRDR
jgi:hypothetical protein